MYLLTHIFASGLTTTTTKQQQLQENILINSADISSDISDGADIIKLTPPTNNDSDIPFVDENIDQLNTDQHKTKNLNQSSSSPKVTITPSPIVSPKIPHPDVIFEEPEKDEADDEEEEEDYFKTNSNDKSQSKQKADNNLLTQPPTIKTQTNIASINRENNLAVAQTTATATSSISTSQQQQHTKPALEVPASNSTSVQNSKIPDRKNASPPEIKGN